MTTRRLPSHPSMERLRSLARDLQRDARAGDDAAIALVEEHHPRPVDPERLRLADAQLVVARAYGFASWPRLKRHLDAVAATTSNPHDSPVDDDVPAADAFLALACLTYGRGDSPDRRRRARRMLDSEPSLATHDIWTMAASGAANELEQLLAERPELAEERGGPHGWSPLLHACYSRLEPLDAGRSTLDVARVLLGHGADPDNGFLWEGLPSPFTALTGALGGGEDAINQPPHPQWGALATLLLEHGADPNDNQALYNRMFDPSNEHLVLLAEHGLGRGDGGPWRRAMPEATESVAATLAMQLQWAAQHDMAARVELLLDIGVDPDGQSGHPAFGGRSALALARRAGATRCVELLEGAGAAADDDTTDDLFVAACMSGDAEEARRLVDADPALVGRLDATDPPTVLAELLTLASLRARAEDDDDGGDGDEHGHRDGLRPGGEGPKDGPQGDLAAEDEADCHDAERADPSEHLGEVPRVGRSVTPRVRPRRPSEQVERLGPLPLLSQGDAQVVHALRAVGIELERTTG